MKLYNIDEVLALKKNRDTAYKIKCSNYLSIGGAKNLDETEQKLLFNKHQDKQLTADIMKVISKHIELLEKKLKNLDVEI